MLPCAVTTALVTAFLRSTLRPGLVVFTVMVFFLPGLTAYDFGLVTVVPFTATVTTPVHLPPDLTQVSVIRIRLPWSFAAPLGLTIFAFPVPVAATAGAKVTTTLLAEASVVSTCTWPPGSTSTSRGPKILKGGFPKDPMLVRYAPVAVKTWILPPCAPPSA